MRWWLIIGILVLPAVPATAREIPSFDCAKAWSEVEKLICADPALSQLDLELGGAYKSALWAGKVKPASQRAWIKRRDECLSAKDVRACLKSRMQQRIGKLWKASGSSAGRWAASTGFVGVCAGEYLDVQPDTPPDLGYHAAQLRLGDTIDCTLADRTELRLRYGEDPAMPYGMCGGYPQKWFSLWVDKRLVLSRHFMGDACHGTAVASLRVDEANIHLCTYIPKHYRTHEDLQEEANSKNRGRILLPGGERAEGLNFGQTCSTIAVNHSLPIDDTEYPSDPTSVPKLGSLVAETQEDAALCRSVLGDDGATLTVPAKATLPSWEPGTPPAYCGHTQRATLDFANEGIDRDVYDWDLCTHAQDGDTYVAIPKGESPPAIPVGEYQGDRLPLPQRAQLWDLGYWHGEVFRIGKVTYVLARPVNEKNDLFLYRPVANGTMQTMCSWRRVQRHF